MEERIAFTKISGAVVHLSKQALGRSAAVILLVFFISACQAWGPNRSLNAGETKLAKDLQAYFIERKPSGAFLFAFGTTVVFQGTYGEIGPSHIPMPDDVVFPIGSISKQFTAAAVLKLAEQGRLSLDDTLDRFFPNVPGDKARITLHQLLSHTSGLPRNVDQHDTLQTREEFRAKVFAAPLQSLPGEKHTYANAGYMLAAQVVEIASGLDFDTYLEKHFFHPLRMSSTGFPGPRFTGALIPEGFDRPKYDEVYSGTPMDEPHALSGWYRRGAGGLLSTTADLYRWQRALMDGDVISAESVEIMLSPHALVTPDGKYKYGYGWVLQDSQHGPIYWHNGAWYSYYTEVRRFPDADLIAIGFTNRQQDETFDETFKGAVQIAMEARSTWNDEERGIKP